MRIGRRWYCDTCGADLGDHSAQAGYDDPPMISVMDDHLPGGWRHVCGACFRREHALEEVKLDIKPRQMRLFEE